jgi:mRNA interferase MazF
MKDYVPQKGDLVTITFDPQSGHEQTGRRPALVISNSLFNERTGMAIVCPLTHTERGFPFHIAVKNTPDVSGFIMVEQVKSVDFRSRKVKRIGKVSEAVLEEVLAILDACLY